MIVKSTITIDCFKVREEIIMMYFVVKVQERESGKMRQIFPAPKRGAEK